MKNGNANLKLVKGATYSSPIALGLAAHHFIFVGEETVIGYNKKGVYSANIH